MKVLLCLSLVGLVGIGSCASIGYGEPGLRVADVAALKKASAAYGQAMRDMDWERVSKFCTRDAVRMPPNQPAHNGREAIMEWLKQVEEISSYSVDILEIQGSAGFAYLRGRYAMALLLKGVPIPVEDEGKWLEVWELRPDGRWRLNQAIWNSDRAPEP